MTPVTRYFLSLLWLMGIAAPTVLAQPAQPPAPGAARVMAWASLHLHFDRRGDVRAILHLTPQPPDRALPRHALAATLRIPPDQVERLPAGLGLLEARAAGILNDEGWSVEGTIDLAPLLDFLKRSGATSLTVYLDHPVAAFSECSLAPLPPRWNQSTSYYDNLPTDPSTPPLRLTFGYGSTYAWRFLPLAAVLLVPIVLTLCRRWSRTGRQDRFVAFHRAWRFQGRLILALWLAWLATVVALGGIKLVGFVLWRSISTEELAWTSIVLWLLLPPVAAVLICKVLSAPAFAGVPEMGWTLGRLLQQGLWSQLGIVATGLCLAYGADAQAAAPSSWWQLGSFVAALGVLIVWIAGWMHAQNPVLHILPACEVRERLFELADEVQVRVRQAHLLPGVAWRLLPILKDLPQAVYVTAEILPQLSRREVDAVLALELARLGRQRSWGWASVVIGSGVGIAWALLAIRIGREPASLLVGVVFLMIFAVRLVSRGSYLSPALDRHALAITGDPEALITALAKLRRLDLLPIGAGREQGATDDDPAQWPRLRELADRAGIPGERLREILARSGSGEDRYPPLPEQPGGAAQADPRVFSLAVKRRASARQVWARQILETAVPALVAFFVQERQWHGIPLAAAYLVGLVLAVLIPRRVVYRLANRTTLALRQGIRDKLVQEGLTPETWGGLFVGLSPHAGPRNYENFLVWDYGFLVLAGDRLCYLGDRTRFALDRASIQGVTIGPGVAGWRPRRVYVRWHDDKHGTGGVFNLVLSERKAPRRSAAKAAMLRQRLLDWLEQPVATSEVPLPLRELPAPNFGAVASESLAKLATVSTLLGIWVLRAPFVVAACFLLGLSFHWEEGAGGWYVAATAALLPVGTLLSYRRHHGGRRDASADADAARIE